MKIQTNPPTPLSSWPAGWLAGRSAGWLAGWLRFLKESLRNPIRILMKSSQPYESVRNPIRFVQIADSQLALPPWLPHSPGWGGVVFIFNFLIFLIFLIIRAMFWGSLWVVFSLTFAVIYNENHEIIKNFSMIFSSQAT